MAMRHFILVSTLQNYQFRGFHQLKYTAAFKQNIDSVFFVIIIYIPHTCLCVGNKRILSLMYGFYSCENNIRVSRVTVSKNYGLFLHFLYQFSNSEKLGICFTKSKWLIKTLFQIMG